MTRTTIVLYFILPTFQQKVKKKRPGAHDSETPCRSIQYIKKKNQAEAWFSMFALPIFTARHQATIVGVHVLNFCVRDGNRWTHMTINTNFW